MASSGLPGFANFVAELLIFIGSWDRYPVQTACAVLGIVITAVYMLRLIRGTFFGASQPAFAHVQDASSPLRRLPYVMLIVALILIGCWPNSLLRMVDSSTRVLIERISPPSTK
jgi:NADH-quinone oxidoreductase subunit M